MINNAWIYFGVALLVALVSGKIVLPLLRRFKFGQSIREEGPESHKKKSGTPTMGGVIFFITVFISPLLLGNLDGKLWIIIIFSLLFGLVGFIDDFLIIKKKQNLGLNAKHKLLLLAFFAILFTYFYINILQYPTTIGLEKYGATIDLGNYYYLFALLLLVGTTNAVNLNDGIDGLCGSITAIAAVFFMVYGVINNDIQIVYFTAILLAACLGFLYYNWNPAKVFMGDTGSLFLGGAIGILSMMTKTEILLPIVGGVYVIETLSVIIQVASFKLTGKRVFRMSPIHHHFELIGWREKKIVYVFSALAVLFGFIGFCLI